MGTKILKTNLAYIRVNASYGGDYDEPIARLY